MDELAIKEVNFAGDTLLAIQDTTQNKIFVGVTWMCKGLGIDARRQREKIQQHATLSMGVSTLPLPSMGGVQDTTVIELDYVPLWLATINPSLVADELKNKLIEYQLKAKDVLATAFLPESNVVPLSKDQALVTVLRTTADLVEGQNEIRQLITEQSTKIEEVERKVDEQITLNSGEQRKVQKAIALRVYDIEQDPDHRSELFRQLHREIKDRWAVSSYKDVRHTELFDVLRYIDAWKPRIA